MKNNDRKNESTPGPTERMVRRIEKLELKLAGALRSGHLLSPEREFCRLIMDAAPVFFVAMDGDGRTLLMNNAMLDALGYTLDEVRGTDYMTTFVPEADRQALAEIFSKLTVEHSQTFNENRVLTRSGDEIIVEWHGRAVTDEDGRLRCFFGVGLDVTEQRVSQAELRAKSEEAQEYLDLAGILFLGLDRDGNISLVNRKGCEVLGGTEEELLGLNWFDTFVPEKLRQQVREVFAGLMAADGTEGDLADYENEILTLNGEKRIIEWHNTVERDADGRPTGTMSSGIDVTERKRAEDVQRLAYNIGSAVHTARNVEELFGRIRHALGAVMNTENFFIALYNRKEDTLSLSYFFDEKDQDDFDSFPAGRTLTGYIIKNDTSLLIDRAGLDRWTEAGIVDRVGTPSLIWLGVPLRVKGEVIGALVVQSYTDANEFGEAEKEMLEFVSEQIGFAIEHKRAEDELQASEAKNRAILDALPDMIFRLDRECRFLSYDAAGDDELALPPDEFLGKRPEEIFPPELAERISAAAEKVFLTGEMQLLEYSIPVPYPDGDVRDFEARMVLSGDGSVLSVVRDITENKRADQFLAALNKAALAMERRMKPAEIFSAASDELLSVGLLSTLFLADESGDSLSIAFTSRDEGSFRAVSSLLGCDIAEMSARVDDVDAFRVAVREGKTVFADSMVEFVRQLLPQPLRSLAPRVGDMLGTTRLILAPTMSDDAVFGVLAVSSDELTERDVPAITAFANQLAAAWRKAMLMRELERSLEELKEAQDQLLQAQKMEAVGRLAGGVAHDFNNLLTAIGGYAELLSCNSSLDEQVHGDIDQIRKAADQAAALTRQLLAFSRRQPLQQVVIDLNKIVVEMDAMLRRLIGEDIELTTVLNETSCQAKADPGQLEQVIINLVVNARDAMPEGGRITISTREIYLDDMACASIPDARPGNFICVSIEDTGAGIEREIMDQIFEPFFSTKGPTKGTGLGLAVVYGIVRQHGGWINVYSEPNQGTVFKVYLPSARPVEDESCDSEKAGRAAAPLGKGQRILLVEDEEAVRSLAVRALTESGYVVFEAGGADEALELFRREGGDFDLVFSDVVLPDRNGVSLIEDLLEMRPDMPVLVSSGYTDQKSQWPVIQEKGFRFLQKPYSLVDLLGTVGELV